ncbi:hypothetical protein OIV83_004499 [Microbotryomycetes sp. JL201]|nr:hypothetical protein OIV83_004499 [Microbotryomycetes sp. JL201]
MPTATVQANGFPVLSWRQALDSPADFISELSDALSTTGFFYLTDLQAQSANWQTVWSNAFQKSQEFFELDEEEKLEIEMIRSRHFRGYSRFGSETTAGKQDQREQIDFGPDTGEQDDKKDIWLSLYGPNQYPRQVKGFKEAIESLRDTCDTVAQRLVHLIARSVTDESHLMTDPFNALYPAYSRMKTVRYKPVPADTDPSLLGVGPHRDGGALTLLAMDDTPGLQVQLWSGEWRTVEPRQYDLVINIGQVIERMTHGVYTSTTHRVLATRGSRSRISIPFFFSPSLVSQVTPVPLDKLLPHARQLVEAGGRQVVSEIRKGDLHEEQFGKAAWRGITRSHQAVWQKYYGDFDELGGPDKFLNAK